MSNSTPTYVKEAAEEIIEHLSLCETSDVKEYTFARDRIESILLKHLPQPSEWVDVNERMPQERIRVSVYYMSTVEPDCFYGIWGRMSSLPLTNDNGLAKWRYSHDEMPIEYPVTHWHPMLQPPEQKEKV